MKFAKPLLSLMKGVAGKFHYLSILKKDPRSVISQLSSLRERQATLAAANSKTHKWLIEQIAESPAPTPVKTPLVSIVMPTWNRRDIIGRAIDSVLQQSYRNWQLIIVDDGSTDGTADSLEKYLADERISYLSQHHRSASSARNVGLARAQGEIIAYIDTDVVWFPGYLANVVAAFAEDEKLDAVYTAQLVEDSEKRFSYVRCEEFNYDQLLQGNYIDLNVFSHRRHLYESEGGFDEELDCLIDWDLILRYAKIGQVRRLLILGGIYTYGRSDQITKTRSRERNRRLIEAKHRHSHSR